MIIRFKPKDINERDEELKAKWLENNKPKAKIDKYPFGTIINGQTGYKMGGQWNG
jgi:hypothetical protein